MTPTEFYAYTRSAKNVRHINSNSTRKHLSFMKFLIQNSGATAWRNTNITYCSLQCTRGSGSVHGPTQKLPTNHSSNTLSIKGNLLPSPNLTFPKICDELCVPRAILTTAPPFTETRQCSQFWFHCSSQTSAACLPKSHKTTSSGVLLWQDLRDYDVYIVGLNLTGKQSKLKVEFRKMLA
jgi:hypothetical protein